MSAIVVVIVSLLALVAGVLAGIFFQRRSEKRRIGTAQSQADKLLKTAKTEAESLQRNSDL